MTPELPNTPRADLEARLTALLLGELPAEEAAALRERIAKDAELAKLYAQLEHTIELVRETAATPADESAEQPAPLRLADDRREKLLARFKTVAPKEFATSKKRKVSWVVPMAAAAVFVTFIGLTMLTLSTRDHGSATMSFSDNFPRIALLSGRSDRGSVTTATDQSTARYASEAALERAKSEAVAQIFNQDAGAVDFTIPIEKQIAGPKSEARDREALRIDHLDGYASGPPMVANNIVLPSSTEVADRSPAPAGSFAVNGWSTDSREARRSSGGEVEVTRKRVSPQAQEPSTGRSSDNRSPEVVAAGIVVQGAKREPSLSPTAAGRSASASIVLPNGAEVADNTKQPSANTPAGKPWDVTAGVRGFYDDAYSAPNTPKGYDLSVWSDDTTVQASGFLGKPPTPSLLARADLAKELPAKPAAIAGSANGGAEADQMSRRFYRLTPAGGGGTGGGGAGGTPAPASKSEISDLPSAPSVAATTPSASPSPTAAGDFFFTTGTTRNEAPGAAPTTTPQQPAPGQASFYSGLTKDDAGGLRYLKPGQPASTPQLAELEKLAEADKNGLSWSSYDRSTRARQLNPTESESAGVSVAASPPPIDPATGLPEPLAAPTAEGAPAQQLAKDQLAIRTFKVDPENFRKGLESVGGFAFNDADKKQSASPDETKVNQSGLPIPHYRVRQSDGLVAGGIAGQSGGLGGNQGVGVRFLTRTNSSDEVSGAARQYFGSLGVEPNKVFYNDREGTLLVRGKEQDLDIIEVATKALNEKPPEVTIKAKFADVAQADQKQAKTELNLDESLGRKPSLSPSERPTATVGNVETTRKMEPAMQPSTARDGSDPNAPAPPAPGAVFLGYDDPGQSVPQANLAANGTFRVPLTAQLPIPHWRLDGKDYYGEPPPGVTLPKDKTPFLGDLSMIGRLFRGDGKATGGPDAVGKPITDADSDVKLQLADGLSQNLALNKSTGGTLALYGANDFSGGAATVNSFVNGGTVATRGGEADKLSTLSGYVDSSQNWNFGTGNTSVPAESTAKPQLRLNTDKEVPSLAAFPSGRIGASSARTQRTYTARGDVGDIYFGIDQDSHKVLALGDEETMRPVNKGASGKKEQPTPEARPAASVASVANTDEKQLKDAMDDTFGNKSGRNHQEIALPSEVAAAEPKSNVYSLSIVGYANVAQDTGFRAHAPVTLDSTAQPSEKAPSSTLSAETLRHIEGTRIESQTELARQKSMADLLRKAQKEQGKETLAQTIQSAAPDAQLGSLLEQQNAARQRLAITEKEFGPSHPEVAKAKVQAEDLRKKVIGRTDEVMAAMDAKVDSLKDGVAKLETEVAELTAKDAAVASKARPYWEAKRQLEELQNSRKVLNMKIAAENTDIALPKSAVVEIVDNAKPPPSKAASLWERLGGAKAGEVASTARVKVERDQNDIQGMNSPKAMNGYDPYFIQTEFELLQSEAILGKVVKDLKLDEAWAKKGTPGGKLNPEEAMGLLKKKLDLHPVKNTGLIEIKAKSDKPEEASKLANAVAEAYKDHRQAQWRERSAREVRTLEGRFQEQEQKIRDAQAKVDKLAAELKVADAAAASAATNTAAKEPEPPKQSRPKAPTAEPQPEVQTCDNAFSTFSLNISDVSFKLALASLEKGQMPDAGSVRSEEFINAFDYRDPDPPPGAPVGYAFERARYPFAQNRDLIRFSLKTAALGRQAGRPLNLVLLLDNSGSMERADRVRIIHEALRVLAGQLQPKDKLSVITFARTARLVADGVSGNEAGKVVEEVSSLTPEGGTNLEEAMNTAYATALRHYLADGINRVVLLTDGAANLGNVEPEALKEKVEAHRKQGVALDCFGIGWEGYNDDLLEVLSRNGDGRYGFINSPEEATTEFAGQLAGALHVAASDVKVQVEFNPKRVVAYRQIGYAKHQLTKQQFRDNTVDAAEIAAQEAGNALYVIEANPRGEGPLGTVRVRYKVPGTSEYHEHEWEAPYSGSAVELEQASPAMRLAATASAFSEWLVSSPFAGEVTPDALLGYLGGVPEIYGADGRPKKLEWAIRQAKSLVGK